MSGIVRALRLDGSLVSSGHVSHCTSGGISPASGMRVRLTPALSARQEYVDYLVDSAGHDGGDYDSTQAAARLEAISRSNRAAA